MNYDIIIVGGGLGGLTAGAKLSKEGKKVLLLEQHDRPGGCATSFARKDYTFEVGLHEMDGPHPRDLKVKIFRDLGITDKVSLLVVPEFYRFVNGRQDLVIPHDPLKAQELLIEKFPEDTQGIQTYFNYILNYKKLLADVPDRSIGEFLDEHIKNDELKLIFLGNLGYFHDDPYTLSLAYYLVAQGSYFGGAASFIMGGSQQLSNALMDVIVQWGGTVCLNSRCTEIVTDGERITGIKYERKLKGIIEQAEAYAKEIIVNASVPDLADKLLPSGYREALSDKIKGLKTGASLLTVYYGFNKPLKDIGNKNYSTFVFDPSVMAPKDIFQNNHDGFEKRSFTFVEYSQLDSGLCPKGKGIGAVCCIDYTSDWEGLSRQEYLKKKADVLDIITSRCDRLIPGFRDAIAYAEVGTSLTVKKYTLNPSGAVYGFARNPGISTDYLSSLPDNIHIASAWGKFGGGFSGAIYSGYMTAMDILRKK